jgi:1-pyrroline-4-hydroxy-2-carboxylate deaminase
MAVQMKWHGVMPAMTTGLTARGEIDHRFVAKHARWMVDHGCTGIVTPGSLGEGNALRFDEKVALWKTVVAAVGDRVPVVAAIAALSTAEAVDLAQAAADAGCLGLMVLPQYVYKGDWRENKAHVASVFKATRLSCMLYNNPVAYGVDFTPENIAELAAEHRNFHAVKESSTDTRRIAAIRALIGGRLDLLVGVDDGIVEAIAMGATGWIAGLVNAFPKESVDLFNYAYNGNMERAWPLYRWFLPLLRLDTVPKFVHLIKLAQQEVGMGTMRLRAPRLPLVGDELEAAQMVIRKALHERPA